MKLSKHKTLATKAILGLFFLITGLHSVAQKSDLLIIEGTTQGYHNDPGIKVFKNEQISLEGTLNNVVINITKNGNTIKKVKSTSRGKFSIEVPLNSIYEFSFSRSGYEISHFKIDVRNVNPDHANEGLAFRGLELILNSYISDEENQNENLGTLYYDRSTGMLKFSETDFKRKSKRKYEPVISLIKQSLSKNNNLLSSQQSNEKEEDVNEKQDKKKVKKVDRYNEEEVIEHEDTVSEKTASNNSTSNFSVVKDFTSISEKDLSTYEKEIENAWKQLELDRKNAVTPEDFARIKEKEKELFAAEKELKKAKKYIRIQDEHIASQQKALYLLIGLIVLLAAFSFVVYRNYREKIKINKILDKQHRNITDSINYASKIQSSILKTEEEVRTLLPSSFIYYSPKDIVSGDFYWVSKVGSKTVVAAVDCTGHGVPGAFMSLIGNTLLNDIITAKKIVKPSEILTALHEAIVDSLNQNQSKNETEDGMDMSICVIDTDKNFIEFSGAMNPLYLLKNNKIEVINADLRGVGGRTPIKKGKEVSFTNKEMKLEKGTKLYLFSDGFMDQFGGENNEKFNIKRFKEMLLELESTTMVKQKEAIHKTISKWRGSYKQIDDILLIGIEV